MEHMWSASRSDALGRARNFKIRDLGGQQFHTVKGLPSPSMPSQKPRARSVQASRMRFFLYYDRGKLRKMLFLQQKRWEGKGATATTACLASRKRHSPRFSTPSTCKERLALARLLSGVGLHSNSQTCSGHVEIM